MTRACSGAVHLNRCPGGGASARAIPRLLELPGPNREVVVQERRVDWRERKSVSRSNVRVPCAPSVEPRCQRLRRKHHTPFCVSSGASDCDAMPRVTRETHYLLEEFRVSPVLTKPRGPYHRLYTSYRSALDLLVLAGTCSKKQREGAARRTNEKENIQLSNSAAKELNAARGVIQRRVCIP